MALARLAWALSASSLHFELRRPVELDTARHHDHQPDLPRPAHALVSVTRPRRHWDVRSANEAAAVNWADAKKRVLHSYRDWLRSVRAGTNTRKDARRGYTSGIAAASRGKGGAS